ncbi:MAG: hypothetical protein QXL96_02560 [Ignisphaera sp.]
MNQVGQVIAEKCGGRFTNECEHYEEFKRIELEVSRVQDLITKLRIITSSYYGVVVPFYKTAVLYGEM